MRSEKWKAGEELKHKMPPLSLQCQLLYQKPRSLKRALPKKQKIYAGGIETGIRLGPIDVLGLRSVRPLIGQGLTVIVDGSGGLTALFHNGLHIFFPPRLQMRRF